MRIWEEREGCAVMIKLGTRGDSGGRESSYRYNFNVSYSSADRLRTECHCPAFADRSELSDEILRKGQEPLDFGDVEEALSDYWQGLLRTPAPPPRDRLSAMKGARRMFKVKRLTDTVVEQVERILA